MIYVLTYDSIHKKTQDILIRLKLNGYNNVTVLATPWIKRKNFIPLIPHRNFKAINISLNDLCSKLKYSLNRIDTDNLNEYFSYSDKGTILIGGAGILAKELVENNKIINSHPAFLPYVRGLDALKWAIYNDEKIGVTSHIISVECDAGKLIKRELVPLYSWDTFHSIAYRQYELEIDLLVSSILDIKEVELNELSTDVSKPMRRMPHSKEYEMLEKLKIRLKKISK